jgi:hypothetical protein
MLLKLSTNFRFWECPNGEGCIYRHALPPGFILKKDRKKMEEQNRLSKITLEEFIEKEVGLRFDSQVRTIHPSINNLFGCVDTRH